MSIYITIDGGTSTTRVNLIKDRQLISTIKLDVGSKDNIANKNLLKTEIRKAIDTILVSHNLKDNQIDRILASGMITSEFGLCKLDHISVPADIKELHNNMHETYINEISPIPFVFIRGVKKITDSFEDTDIMRGEETELMGLMDISYGECVYVLSGSHSKLIKINSDGFITDFSSMLTGEMIAAISNSTILCDSIDLNSELNKEFLIKGYDYAEKSGINQALFKVRILNNIFGCSKSQVYSFFMGVILHDEVKQLINYETSTIVISGKAQIKNALSVLLKNYSGKQIVIIDDNKVDISTSIGMIKIYEHK